MSQKMGGIAWDIPHFSQNTQNIPKIITRFNLTHIYLKQIREYIKISSKLINETGNESSILNFN